MINHHKDEKKKIEDKIKMVTPNNGATQPVYKQSWRTYKLIHRSQSHIDPHYIQSNPICIRF